MAQIEIAGSQYRFQLAGGQALPRKRPMLETALDLHDRLIRGT